MEVYSAKEKDDLLFDIVKAHPNNIGIKDNDKHNLIKDVLIPNGYVELLVRLDQDNEIIYVATEKGISFILEEGGYTQRNKLQVKRNQRQSIIRGIKGWSKEIAIGVLILVVYAILSRLF